MAHQRTYRVFVSYTGKDLAVHAEVVAKVLRSLQHLAIDHRDSGATGQPSVEWCMEQVDSSDFLVVLVAHRYGWVPRPEEGGDGRKSITQMEVDRANEKKRIVLPYLIEDDASWPVDQVEALSNPSILKDLNDFKARLRLSVAAFFSDARSLDGPLSRDIPKAIARLEKANRAVAEVGAVNRQPQPITPWIYRRDDPPTLEERMAGGLPKRILSLQGGGVRVAVLLGYLEKLERLLQVRYGEPDFRLADYFDLIGGVGLSSLVALELARRRSVAEASDTLEHVMERGFKKRFLVLSAMGPRYSTDRLSQTLDDLFGDVTLADSVFTTGFAIPTTSLVRAQPVVISNHPALVSTLGPQTKLAAAAFASIAFAGFVAPAIVSVHGAQDALVDGQGGIGRDPSLALLLLVASPHFPFRWRLGQHRLYLTAVGYDTNADVTDVENVRGGSLLSIIGPLLSALTESAAYQTRMIMEALALEGANEDKGFLEQSSALTYRRYAASLAPEVFAELGIQDPSALQAARFDTFELFQDFVRVGRAGAEQDIRAIDFPAPFDVRIPAKMDAGRNTPESKSPTRDDL